MPLLTKEQQAVLDAEVAAQKEANGGGGSDDESNAAGAASSSGKTGYPKKSTKAKKKGPTNNWGTVMDSTKSPIYAVDKSDPNWDSCDDNVALRPAATPHVDAIVEYKHSVTSLLEEYFECADVQEALESLSELDVAAYTHFFVKRTVTLALDRGSREKEMAAQLLSASYPDYVRSQNMSKGFIRLLEAADDLALDVPDVASQLGLFVARAVVDDILPPAFIKTAELGLQSSHLVGREALRQAQGHLSARHASTFILNVWEDRTATSVDTAKVAIARVLAEYLAGGDAQEAARSVQALHVPFFCHELVKKALTAAIEVEKPPAEEPVIALLKHLSDVGVVTTTQLSKGVSRMEDTIKDLAIDVPKAEDKWAALKEKLVKAGLHVAPPAPPPAEEDDSARLSSDPQFLAFKQEVTDIIRELFASGDTAEAARRLKIALALGEEEGQPGSFQAFGPYFVKRLVVLALDHHAREKEIAAGFLSFLYPETLGPQATGAGFRMLLEAMEDLSLDVPGAPESLLLFTARAVVDDILPPSWLGPTAAEMEGKAGGEVAKQALVLLSARHASERVLRAWGGAGAGTAQLAKQRVQALLVEYADTKDRSEACRCFQELSVPFYAHELVKQALVMAIEKDLDGPMVALLKEMGEIGLISRTQMEQGMKRVQDALEDLALDVPNAAKKWEALRESIRKEGVLNIK